MGDLSLEDVNRANSGTELQGEANPGSDFKAPFALKVGPYVGDLNDHLPQRDFDAIQAFGNRNGNGVVGTSSGDSSSGVVGLTHGGENASGVRGVAGFGAGVAGESTSGTGVLGRSTNGRGVWGVSDFIATVGDSVRGTGVMGHSQQGPGVFGLSDQGHGIYGQTSGDSATRAVVGEHTAGGAGVEGKSKTGTGVLGSAWNGFAGVQGVSDTGIGVYGAGSPAGQFQGDVHVSGSITKANMAFKIDHPLDPENKYLLHNGVECPEMKTVYDGVATLDDEGHAIVALPEWFEALNGDYRYQLTCLGQWAAVFVAEEIRDNRFEIAGGEPGMRVCWQVTGIRRDAYARANPGVVEQTKSNEERGRYLHPEVRGLPVEQGLFAHNRNGQPVPLP